MADTPFHIVVAEGDSHGRLVLEDTVGALNRGQVKITRVYDGTELLRYLNAAAAGEAGHAMPDTVLLDINLSGSGGFDTLEALKADGRFRRLPVCVISAMRTWTGCSTQWNWELLTSLQGPTMFQVISGSSTK